MHIALHIISTTYLVRYLKCFAILHHKQIKTTQGGINMRNVRLLRTAAVIQLSFTHAKWHKSMQTCLEKTLRRLPGGDKQAAEG